MGFEPLQTFLSTEATASRRYFRLSCLCYRLSFVLFSSNHPLLVLQIIKFGQVHGCPLKSTFPTAKGGLWDVCESDTIYFPACPPKVGGAALVSWVMVKTVIATVYPWVETWTRE